MKQHGRGDNERELGDSGVGIRGTKQGWCFPTLDHPTKIDPFVGTPDCYARMGHRHVWRGLGWSTRRGLEFGGEFFHGCIFAGNFASLATVQSDLRGD